MLCSVAAWPTVLTGRPLAARNKPSLFASASPQQSHHSIFTGPGKRACTASCPCATCRSTSLLHQFGFWRVVLDEAQLVANSSSVAAVMASSLWRRHAWVVTGTPISAR